MVAANPLLEAIFEFLDQGKKFVRISPDKTGDNGRNVTFEFSDGSVDVRYFMCDASTFMESWKQTSAYLKNTKTALDAFEAPHE
jgi:hypothetical protein